MFRATTTSQRPSEKQMSEGSNYSAFLAGLKAKDHKAQLKAAKEFHAYLLNELKQVKRDDETNFIDPLISVIRELANENNNNIYDKHACIYIITSIISLDNINVKIRKKHQTSLFRFLRNILVCQDPVVIYMAARAMGKYAQAGVDCDVDFKSILENLKNESKRFQSILLLRELSLASPSRLFLNASTFYEHILVAVCDKNILTRYEATDLFRLSLIICISRESTMPTSTAIAQPPTSASIANQRRISTGGNHLGDDFIMFGAATKYSISSASGSASEPMISSCVYYNCFHKSLRELESILDELSLNSGNLSSSRSTASSKEDRIHGYLLILLEILKFSNLKYEKLIDKHLTTYNLYHQQKQQQNRISLLNSNNSSSSGVSLTDTASFENIYESLNSFSLNNLASPTAPSSASASSRANISCNTVSSGFTCEEMHALNLLKLLPYSGIDPFHANDPFMFLFKSEKISVNNESRVCYQIIKDNYDRIFQASLNTIRALNLTSSSNITNQTNKAINDTILALLPRLVNFDKSKFQKDYITKTLNYLNAINNNTTFLNVNLSGSSQPLSSNAQSGLSSSTNSTSYQIKRGSLIPNLLGSMGASSSSSVTASLAQSTLPTQSNQLSSGSLKSELIFCVGFLSIALGDSSDEFCSFAKQFIESIRTSKLMSGQELQKKRISLINSGSMHNSANFTAPTNDYWSLTSSSSSPSNAANVSSSGIQSQSSGSNINNFIANASSSSSSNSDLVLAQINELNSIMACISMLASSMVSTTNITDSIMVLLEPLMLCSGGVTSTMRYCLNEICKYIPNLKANIHENLLKILSQILTNKPLNQIIQNIPSSASNLIRSNNYYSQISSMSTIQPSLSMLMLPQMNPNGTYSIASTEQISISSNADPESIVQALQTLRAFEFSTIYMIAFLKYCIDYYLQHDSCQVKIEAVQTTSYLIGRLINELNGKDSRSLISIISCALRKLLICAITDYEADVRYNVLNSLDNDHKFNAFVALPENLNILFMCVRDERSEIRELSSSMISRLSASNSAYIQPFIRKILMQLLTEVEIYPDILQREKSVRLIGHLFSRAPRLVNLYSKPFIDSLNTKLDEFRNNIPFASSIVTVVGQMASQASLDIIKNFDLMIPFLIESMQEFYYIQLRHTSLWTLGKIISIGYAIEPYRKYPKLLDILLGFLKSETVPEIRRETIRILGLIGAIDPFEFKKTLKDKQEVLAITNTSSSNSQQLQLINTAATNSQSTNSSNQDSKSLAKSEIAQIEPIELLVSNGSLEEYYPALAIHIIMKTIRNSVSILARKDAIQALTLAMKTLDNRCVNYVDLVIPTFLDLIKTVNDNLVIDLINQFSLIVSYIKKHIEPYLDGILSVIEHYWNSNEKQLKTVFGLIELIQSIVNAMQLEFKPYLPRVLPLILKQLKQEITDGSCTNTKGLLQLLRSCTCGLDNYVHLILTQFAEYLAISQSSSDRLNSESTSTHSNDDMLRYIALKQEIMYTIYTFAKQITLSDNCAILFQSFIKILEQHSHSLQLPNNPQLNQQMQSNAMAFLSQSNYQSGLTQFHNGSTPPILSITYILFSLNNSSVSKQFSSLSNDKINSSTNLGQLTLETLYLLARQMSGRFYIYAPMFDNIIMKNKNYSKLYDQLINHCRQATYHTTLSQSIGSPGSNIQDLSLRKPNLNDSFDPSSGAFNASTHNQGHDNAGDIHPTTATFKHNQEINFGNLKACIEGAESLTSKEAWRLNFRNLMLAILQETPVSTLRSCTYIAFEVIPPDLFNACFVSIWDKLNEKHQNELIRYLELALTNSDVTEIINTILNLAEFIERCDIGFFLPIDARLLAETAIQVKSYAKALHYVEEQFHSFMKNSPIFSNFHSQTNAVIGASVGAGVGGVFGAGNGIGANVLQLIPQSQHQQYLINLLEQLVTLNHELQRTEAAMGVLDYASKYLKQLDSQTKVKERWYEKLHQWQKALNLYEAELNVELPIAAQLSPSGASKFIVAEPSKLNETKLEQLMGRLRCLKGLGEWEKLNHSCDALLDFFDNLEQTKTNEDENCDVAANIKQSQSNLNLDSSLLFPKPITSQTSMLGSSPNPIRSSIVPITSSSSTSVLNNLNENVNVSNPFYTNLNHLTQTKIKSEIAEMGAAACWGLGKWDDINKYVGYLPENNFETSLYKTIIAINEPSDNESNYRKESKESSAESSDIYYDYKEKCYSLIDKTRDLLDANLTSMASQSYDRSYQGIIYAQVLAELEEIITYNTVPSKCDSLREIWWNRLQGCERTIEHWHRLLLVKSIVLPKEKYIKPWLKFTNLCQKTGHSSLANQILTSLLNYQKSILFNQLSQSASSQSLNNLTRNRIVDGLFSNRDYELCQYSCLKYNYSGLNKQEAIQDLKDFIGNNLKFQLIQYERFIQFQIQQQQMANMQQNMGQMPNVMQMNAPQLPISFQLTNPREMHKRKTELDQMLAKCYLKLGKWEYEMEGFKTQANLETIINSYENAKTHNQDYYKAWQAYAYANYEAIQYFKNLSSVQANTSSSTASLSDSTNNLNSISNAMNVEKSINSYVKSSINGFFMCIKLNSSPNTTKPQVYQNSSHQNSQDANCLQDTLRLLTIWFEYCTNADIYDTLNEVIKQTRVEIWLQVLPQLIARIDSKQFVSKLINNLLTDLGRVHPQALVYRLILASKCSNSNVSITSTTAQYQQQQSTRNVTALKILHSLRENNNNLVEQAKLVSEELIRVAILWHEMWHESLEEASKLYFGEKNVEGMLDTLDILHNMMDRGPTTDKENGFMQAYGRDLNEAKEFCRRFRQSRNNKEIDMAWEKYYAVFKRITKQLQQITSLELNSVSPKLVANRDFELAVPGTYEPNKPLIRIRAFNSNIQVISSKQRPRKISMYGSNGYEYVFLLKGHEDLRQDERVMQIFGLVNNLLLKNHETARRDLAIQRYSVIPLSQNSGLLEWLLNCDTMHSLIKEYREKKSIVLNFEHKIIMKLAPDYEHLTPIQKVQIFEMAIENSSGDDLAKILWHKSLTADKWLERRTNYTRSLAVMSMVGYVLGLGDRHPSNLMIDRINGKIIHVDFGDCFETAMTREKFPEKIPFRLTRMLKNAMEVTGIEGTFRRTCESVMKVLRSNRDSVMAVLEAFVYDPLVYWKLVEATAPNNQQQALNINNPSQQTVNNLNNANLAQNQNNQSGTNLAQAMNQNASATNLDETTTEETNRKAIMVLNRVKDKLFGNDFADKTSIDEQKQVDLLIRQATSSENLSQCFIGWCAWW